MNDNTYKELICDCEKMMQNCGFVLPKINYGFNKRLSSVGVCKKRREGVTIELSKPYYDARLKNNDIKSIKSTILHEMCHAMPNGGGHGYGWKKYVNTINRKFGYDIKRLADDSESINEVSKSKAKYQFVCEDCGEVINQVRMSKFVTDYERYTCAKCKGKFKRVL